MCVKFRAHRSWSSFTPIQRCCHGALDDGYAFVELARITTSGALSQCSGCVHVHAHVRVRPWL